MTKDKVEVKPVISLGEQAFISHVVDLVREILIWKELHPDQFAEMIKRAMTK